MDEIYEFNGNEYTRQQLELKYGDKTEDAIAKFGIKLKTQSEPQEERLEPVTEYEHNGKKYSREQLEMKYGANTEKAIEKFGFKVSTPVQEFDNQGYVPEVEEEIANVPVPEIKKKDDSEPTSPDPVSVSDGATEVASGSAASVETKPTEEEPEQGIGWFDDLKGVLQSGAASAAGGLYGIKNFADKALAATILSVMPDKYSEAFNKLSPEERQYVVNRATNTPVGEIAGALSIKAQRELNTMSEEIAETTRQYEGNIVDDIDKGNYDQAAYRTLRGVVGSAPSIAVAMVPGIGLPATAASAASQKQYELEKEGEDLDLKSVLNSTINGVAEGLLERYTAKMGGRFIRSFKGKAEAAKEFSGSLIGAIAKDLGMESLSEGATSLIQDLSDKLVQGREVSWTQIAKNVADAGIVGAATGAGMGAPSQINGYIAAKSIKKERNELINNKTAEAIEFEEQSNLPDVPEELKTILTDKATSLRKEVEDITNEELARADKMSPEAIKDVFEIEKKKRDIADEVRLIEENEQLSESVKEKLINDKSKAYNDLEAQRESLGEVESVGLDAILETQGEATVKNSIGDDVLLKDLAEQEVEFLDQGINEADTPETEEYYKEQIKLLKNDPINYYKGKLDSEQRFLKQYEKENFEAGISNTKNRINNYNTILSTLEASKTSNTPKEVVDTPIDKPTEVTETPIESQTATTKEESTPEPVTNIADNSDNNTPAPVEESTETPTESVQGNPVNTNPEQAENVNGTDAELERKMLNLEGKGRTSPEAREEYNRIEKELEKREWDSVFNAPLNEVESVVDGLIKKEKEMPTGYGSFIEAQDARETKAVAKKYKEPAKHDDKSLINDFKDALFGRPTTWYADGLKLKQSANELAKRGHTFESLIEEVKSEFKRDGFDENTAIIAVKNMLEPVFRTAKAESKAPKLDAPKPKKKSKPKKEVQEVVHGKGTFKVETDPDGKVRIFTSKGEEVKEFRKPTKAQAKKGTKPRNATYSSVYAKATGAITDNQVKAERDRLWNETRDSFVPDTPLQLAEMAFANGERVSRDSASKETGEDAKNLKWATGFGKENSLQSVERLAERLTSDNNNFEESEVRDAIIEVLSSNNSIAEIQDRLIDINQQAQDQASSETDRQQMDAYLSGLSPKELSLFEAIQFDESIDQLSAAEKSALYEQEFSKQIESLSEQDQSDLYDGHTKPTAERVLVEGRSNGPSNSKNPSEAEVDTVMSRVLNQDNVKGALDFLDSLKLDPNNLSATIPFAPQSWNLFIDAVKAAVKVGNTLNNAIQEAVKALEEANVSAKEIDNIEATFRDSVKVNYDTPKEAPAPPKKTPKKEVKEDEEDGSGIKKALVDEKTVEDTPLNKRTITELHESGKVVVESGIISPEALIQTLNDNPRPLTAEEVATLVYYKRTIDNKYNNAVDKLENAAKAKDQGKLLNAKEEINILERQLDAYQEMSLKTAYEMGLAFRARQLMLNSDYTIQSQIRKYKAINEGAIPDDVRIKFEEWDRQMKELNSRIEALEKERLERENQIQQPQRKEPSKPVNLKNINLKSKNGLKAAISFLDGIESDLDAFGKETLGMNVPVVVLKKAVQAMKLSLKTADSTAQMIQAGIDYIKTTDWYKGLSSKEQGEVPGFFTSKILKQKPEKAPAEKGKKKEKKEKAPKSPFTVKDGELKVKNSFIRELVTAGYDTIDSLTDYVHSLVVQEFPDVSNRQVRDAITDYGKTINLSKDEISVKVRGLRRVGKLISSLEDVRKQMRPKRSGVQRDKLSQKERALMREIKEGLKDLPIDEAEAAGQWKSALEGTKTRLKNRIEDLKKQIEAGQREKAKKGIKLDAEGERLKQEVEELNGVLDAISPRHKMSDEARVALSKAAVEKSIKEYERRIKENDFESSTKEASKLQNSEVDKLREKRDALKKEFDELKKNSPEGLTARENAKLKAINKRIAELNDKILTKRIQYETVSGGTVDSENVKKAKAELKKLQDVLEEMRESEGLAEQKRLETHKKRLQRSIDNYETRIKEKDFAPKEARKITLDKEAKALEVQKTLIKNKFETEKEKARLANRTNWEKIKTYAVDVLNIPRSMMASADLSAPLRQGAMLSFRHPKKASKAFTAMMKQAFSQKAADEWMAEVQNSEAYAMSRKAKLYLAEPTARLTAREEDFMSNLAERIPIWGHVIKGSQRAYAGYLNKLRFDTFVHLSDNLKMNGYDPDVDIKPYKDMANFINNATGRGDLGILENSAPIMNAMLFSPRWVVSRLNILNPAEYAKMNPVVRKEALRTVFTYAGSMMVILGLAAAAGAEVEEDPRSSDFGKIKIGNTRMDMGAGFLQWMRLFTQLVTKQGKSTRTGEIYDIDPKKFPYTSRGTLLLNFGRSKLSPISSLTVDLLNEKNMIGEEIHLGERALDMIKPLYLTDVIEIAKEEGAANAAFFSVPSMFGVGVQHYDTGGDKKKELKKTASKDVIF